MVSKKNYKSRNEITLNTINKKQRLFVTSAFCRNTSFGFCLTISEYIFIIHQV